MIVNLSDAARILLMQLQHLGDVILTTPAIRAVRRRYPNARIDFLTSPLGAQALDGNPHLDHLLVAPSLSLLLRTRYHAVADLECGTRTGLYTLATLAPIRAGVRRSGVRAFAYTHLRAAYSGEQYMAQQKLQVLEPLGITDGTLELELVTESADREWARAAVAQLRRPIIAISPVAQHPAKQWGVEKWAAAADALAAEGGSIVITSGPGQLNQAREVAQRMTHGSHWHFGATTVKQLTALYQECSLWLGNDGGPKHMAVAAGIPTVTVYRANLGDVWGSGSARDVAINAGGDPLTSVPVDRVLAGAARARNPQVR